MCVVLTNYGAAELEIDQLEESGGVEGGIDETCFVDSRGGHC